MADEPPPPSFPHCVFACWDNPDFMREYRRLTGHTLGAGAAARNGLEAMIDKATGHDPKALDHDEATAFLTFVHDHIWLPLQPTEVQALVAAAGARK